MRSSDPSSVFPGDDSLIAEAWRLIARHWLWIVAGLAVGLIAAVCFLFLRAPTFQASVIVRVGQVAGSGLFETSEVLSSRLLAQYGSHVADGIRRERPFLARAAPARGVPGAIELVADAYRPEEAAALLERVVSEIDKRHAEIYRSNFEPYTERLKSLDAQRGMLDEQYKEVSELIERLKDVDATQASVLALERARITQLMQGLEAEKPILTQRLTPPHTLPTERLGEIVAPARPATPRKVLVLALGAVLGVALGLFGVLVAGLIRGSGHPGPYRAQGTTKG